MRSVTIRLTSENEGFHPFDEALVEAADIDRVSIREIRSLEDGTALVLYVLRGDLTRATEILSNHETVSKHTISGTDRGIAYIHFQPEGASRELLRIIHEFELVLQTPVECLSTGIRLTIIADGETIRQAVARVPDDLSVSLESICAYEYGQNHEHSILTPRQHEVLDTAVECGYYELPRELTTERLADQLGIAQSTMGEHLRKIESRIIMDYVSE